MTYLLNREYDKARKEKGRKLTQHELKAVRYVPASYDEERFYPEFDAIVYIGAAGRGNPAAMGFHGQARKPAFHL